MRFAQSVVQEGRGFLFVAKRAIDSRKQCVPLEEEGDFLALPKELIGHAPWLFGCGSASASEGTMRECQMAGGFQRASLDAFERDNGFTGVLFRSRQLTFLQKDVGQHELALRQ